MPSRISSVSIAAAVCLTACSPGEPPAPVAPAAAESRANPEPTAARDTEAWTTLFGGTTLDGWNRVGDANWTLGTDGSVDADDGNGFLVSVQSYADFDLEAEFWVSADANSGIFVRCANPAEIGAMSCYEVNIFDQRPDPAYRTGAIVDVASPAAQVDTADRWNTYAISARGPRLTVVLNGQTTVDTEDGRFAAGPIALQRGAGTVRFRNVRIRVP